MRSILGSILVMAAAHGGAASAATEKAAASLLFVGCDVVKESFLDALAAAYERETGTSVSMELGGDAASIKAVRSNPRLLGAVCRELFDVPDERKLRAVHLGWGALAVAVNQKNPVSRVSLEDLRRIYDGKVTSWRELGGKDQPVVALARAPGKFSGVGYSMRLLVFQDLEHSYAPSVRLTTSSTAVEDGVAKDENAIGISDVVSLKKQPAVKVLPLADVVPNKANIATGRYPLFRPLFLLVHEDHERENPALKSFLAFALSPEGQTIISREGTVNLSEGAPLASKYPWRNRAALLQL